MAAIKIIKPCPCDIVKPIAGLFLQEDETIFTDYSSVTFSAIYPITSDNAKIALQPVGNIKVGDRVKLGGGTYPTDVFTVGSIELKAGVLSVILDTPFVEGGGMPSAETAAKIDHNLIVKTTNSEHDGIDISNHSDYLYTHNFIIDGTITFDVSAVGGASVVVSSDSFTNSEVAEIQNITSGTMSSTSGYVINEYQLLYKLVLWGYINHSYTRTVRPYISINEIQNTNNATEAINYKLPCSTITANKAALTMTTDCLAVIWSDGAILDNEGTASTISGAGSGDFYLFGDYTKLVATGQSISSIDVLSDSLVFVELNNNAIVLTDTHLLNKFDLERLNVNNTFSNLTDGSISNKIKLKFIDVSNTDVLITNIRQLVNLTLIDLRFSNSLIEDTDLENHTLVNSISVGGTDSAITAEYLVNNQLENLVTFASNSLINDDIKTITTLKRLVISNNDEILTDAIKTLVQLTEFICGFSSKLQLTDESYSRYTLIEKIKISESENTTINTSSVINKNSLNTLEVANCKGQITAVNVATRIIDVSGLSEQTAANNNTLIQNLIDNTRTGKKELTFTAHADIDQSNVDLLVQAEWDVTQKT
jgi:hypothetical protein